MAKRSHACTVCRHTCVCKLLGELATHPARILERRGNSNVFFASFMDEEWRVVSNAELPSRCHVTLSSSSPRRHTFHALVMSRSLWSCAAELSALVGDIRTSLSGLQLWILGIASVWPLDPSCTHTRYGARSTWGVREENGDTGRPKKQRGQKERRRAQRLSLHTPILLRVPEGLPGDLRRSPTATDRRLTTRVLLTARDTHRRVPRCRANSAGRRSCSLLAFEVTGQVLHEVSGNGALYRAHRTTREYAVCDTPAWPTLAYLVKSNVRLNQTSTIRYSVRKFDARGAPKNTMTRCRAWGIILLIVVTWQAIVNANTSFVQTASNNADKKSFDSSKYIYSWTGPNALVRSALVERQERLQYNCELESSDVDISTLNPESFRNILVDDSHELLYCYVPKVACTNWKRVLMIAMGKWSGNDPLKIPANQAHSPGIFQRLSNYTLPEIEEKLTTYDKLIIVRHPLERLLSAYRNKLEARHEKSARYFQSRFGKKIIKKYRPNATEKSLKNGDDVTFSEFVDFITDGSENGTRNEHWRPIYELCQPCIVNYNLVSKYESLVEDATEVLERIGVTSVNFPPRPPNSEPTSRKLDKYYSTLSYKQLRKLADLYRLDLRLFDYSLEDLLGFSLA